jgi:hypothetical protein
MEFSECDNPDRITPTFSDNGDNGMKSKIVAICVLASSCLAGYSGATFADLEGFCYAASGKVTTQNVTLNNQVGSIEFELKDSNNEIVFNDTGSLVGRITGSDGVGSIILSHAAKFSKGNNFVTNGDKATITAIVGWDGETPCAFTVYEEITEVAGGTKFFNNVVLTKIGIYGTISYCPNENINEFDILPYTSDGNVSQVCFDSAKP